MGAVADGFSADASLACLEPTASSSRTMCGAINIGGGAIDTWLLRYACTQCHYANRDEVKNYLEILHEMYYFLIRTTRRIARVFVRLVLKIQKFAYHYILT